MLSNDRAKAIIEKWRKIANRDDAAVVPKEWWSGWQSDIADAIDAAVAESRSNEDDK